MLAQRTRSASWRHLVCGVVLLLPLLAGALATPAGARAPDTLPTAYTVQYSHEAGGNTFQDLTTGPGATLLCAGTTGDDGTTSRLLLVKYEDVGTGFVQDWARTWAPAGGRVRGRFVKLTSGGDAVVAGTTGANGHRDILVVRYDGLGNLKYHFSYDGPAHRDDNVTGLALDAHGNAYVCGASVGVHSGMDYVVIKIGPAGTRLWVKRFGWSRYDAAAGIAVTPSGTSFVTGDAEPPTGWGGAMTLSLTSSGALRWKKIYAPTMGASGTAITVRSSGANPGVFVAGSRWTGNASSDDLLLIKYSSAGAQKWRRSAGNDDGTDEGAAVVVVDGNGAPTAAGPSNNPDLGQSWGFLAGTSATGYFDWQPFAWSFDDADSASFEALALAASGQPVAGGWGNVPGQGKDFAVMTTSGHVPHADAFIDGSAHADDRCHAVAVVGSAVYGAGELRNTGTGQDAVLVKFAP